MKYRIKKDAIVKHKGSFYGWLDSNKEFKLADSGLAVLAPLGKNDLSYDDYVTTAWENIEKIEDETE